MYSFLKAFLVLMKHELLDFCATYLCEAVSSKLIIINSKTRSFFKNAKNVRCPVLFVSIYEWMICEKLSSESIPLVVLENIYKLNCCFVDFFALLFSLRGSFISALLRSWNVCLCMISPKKPSCDF